MFMKRNVLTLRLHSKSFGVMFKAQNVLLTLDQTTMRNVRGVICGEKHAELYTVLLDFISSWLHFLCFLLYFFLCCEPTGRSLFTYAYVYRIK